MLMYVAVWGLHKIRMSPREQKPLCLYVVSSLRIIIHESPFLFDNEEEEEEGDDDGKRLPEDSHHLGGGGLLSEMTLNGWCHD